ncbi:hypothetical protein LV164_005130 [Aspergillus fumigatus]|nr:hypothetical protein KXX42_009141 [Aspergillus fumigatus]KAH1557811.1 hypothetical protein KXX57_000028 [Aspergillus fumigatus]KAH2320141.1 hypothetical protein KXV47_002484 [Aspergillus fumigatus]KAH2674593.1 hypothetical protein KXV32_006001 [Aspergillus fumigatus]KAH2771437.1 hypothetical protein KXV94_003486 [Aspergillus fumigatus]
MKWDISSPRFYKASANATVRQISFLSTDPPLPQYKDYNAVAIDNLRTEEEECKQLLRIAEASTVEDTSGTPRWDRAMINTGGAGQILATDQRKCESVIVDTPELADKLLARLMPFMKKEGVDHIHNQPLVPGLGGRGKACRLSRLNEKLRFLGYVGGEYFRPHWDSNYITPDEEEEESFYTLHLYLNGDGEQGPQELMQVSKKAEIGPEANVNMNPEANRKTDEKPETKQKATARPSPPQSLTIEGQTYRTDQWTNTPDTILSHVGRRLYLDENHPLAITRKLIESQFPGPVYGNYSEKNPVVSVAQNFDVLGFAPDHPGRSRTDTYYINDKTVLRTHTSAHQQAYFQQINRNEATRPEEVGYTVVADVYRRDAIDRSHYPVFHQMEGAMLWKRPSTDPLKHAAHTAAAIMEDVNRIPAHGVPVEDPNPTIHVERNPLQTEHHAAEEVEAVAAHLKRSLERMVVKIFSEAREATAAADPTAQAEPLKVRWVEAYFPFTSPSWELEVFWQGDWLEILGCGVIKQDLLINSDVPDRIGWAFGLGLERIAMLLFNIPDIRLFWSRDERFLSQFKAGQITRFEPFSKHPACYKDVAFWLPSAAVSGVSAAGGAVPIHENDIMEIVRGVAGDLVEDVRLIDEFTHPKTGRKSMCYRINYRSLERTLTNEETNGLHEKLREKLVSQLGVELR